MKKYVFIFAGILIFILKPQYIIHFEIVNNCKRGLCFQNGFLEDSCKIF